MSTAPTPLKKLAILAHLAYGVHVDWTKVPRTGIDSLLPIDLQWAQELGHRIKLLAVARLTDQKRLELHVSPTLVRMGTPMAEVRGANNAVGIVGDMVGSVFYQGLGAGRLPTASAVVADLVDTVVGRAAVTFKTLDWWSKNRPKADLAESSEAKSRFYVRLQVDDHPGVLAQITGILSQRNISIASLIQRELGADLDDVAGSREETSLIIMTHATAEGCLDGAIQEIDQLASVKSSSVRMRVLD